MCEKIINDLMDAAEDMKCNRCPIRDCPNYDASDREACLFTLAANAISSLEKENRTLKTQVDHLAKQRADFSKQLADAEVRQLRDIAKLVEINSRLEKELTEVRLFIRELFETNSQKEDEE